MMKGSPHPAQSADWATFPQGEGPFSAHKIPTSLGKLTQKRWVFLTLIGIWERDDGLADLVEANRESWALPARVVRGSHPADFSGLALDLLAVSPRAVGWAGAGNLACRAALLPGAAAPLLRVLRCDAAVTYGPAPRDDLTFSSLSDHGVVAVLQRGLVTLDGRAAEPQEWPLALSPDTSPLALLAAAGVQVLMGGILPNEN